MAQIAEILYPVAFNDLGDLVKIEDALRQRGLRYSCVHCSDRMSAVVRVTRRKPHFRHTKSLICDPDSVLHSTAIEIIRNAHNTAQSANSPYLLTRPCEHYDVKRCSNNSTEIDLADGWESKTEKSIVEGTRSDLIFSHVDGRQIIIEVVNTHSMEPETETAYRKSGIPVVVVQIKWETVETLGQGIRSDESRNFGSDECDECKNKRFKAQEILERRCKIVDQELAEMRRQRHFRPKFQPFYEARPTIQSLGKPTRIFLKTQRKVFANAIILTELGFVQSNPDEKPWLFVKTIHRSIEAIVKLYADLGGSFGIPIYEDMGTRLYTSLEFGGPLKVPYLNDVNAYMNGYIVWKFGERMQSEGVQVSTSVCREYPFQYPYEMIDFEPIDVNPVRRVDSRILGSMLERNLYSGSG